MNTLPFKTRVSPVGLATTLARAGIGLATLLLEATVVHAQGGFSRFVFGQPPDPVSQTLVCCELFGRTHLYHIGARNDPAVRNVFSPPLRQQILFTYTVNYPDFPMREVRLTLRSGLTEVVIERPVAPTPRPSQTEIEWTGEGVPDGIYDISAVAITPTGETFNLITVPPPGGTFRVIRDSQPPEITVFELRGTLAPGHLELVLEARDLPQQTTDISLGASYIHFSTRIVNRGTGQEVSPESFSLLLHQAVGVGGWMGTYSSATLPDVYPVYGYFPDGDYTMEIVAYDQAGNGQFASKDFSLSNGRPTAVRGLEDLALHFDRAFQPVQVVWQQDPGSPPDYPATDDMQELGERRWAAHLPMIKDKRTRLFGYWGAADFSARRWVRGRVINYSTQPRSARVRFAKVRPGVTDAAFHTTGLIQVPGGAGGLGPPGVAVFQTFVPIPDPFDPEEDFRFDAAGNWEIEASLVETGGNALDDLNLGNNRFSVAVQVRQSQRLRVLFQPVQFLGDDLLSAYPRFFTALPGQSDWLSSDFVTDTFPVAEHGYSRAYNPSPWLICIPPGLQGCTLDGWRNLPVPPLMDTILRRAALGLAAISISVSQVLSDQFDRIALLCPPGMLRVDGVVGLFHPLAKRIILVEWNQGSATVAHELGHSFGLNGFLEGEQYNIAQVPPGHGFHSYGYWIRMREYQDSTPGAPFFSFMGSASPTWIAKPDYRRLMNEFTRDHLDPELLLFRGMLHADGRFTPLAWHRFQGFPDVELGSTGSVHLVFLDAGSNLLARVGFTPDFHVNADFDGIAELEAAPLAFSVPWPAETARVQLRGTNGALVFERSVSPAAPTLAFSDPTRSAAVFTNGSVLRWDAADADGDPLSYSVWRSPSGTNDWTLVAADLNNPELALAALDDLPSGFYDFTVIASDGLNQVQSRLDCVRLSTKTPGTDPSLRFRSVRQIGSDLVLEFTTVAGRRYQLEHRSDFNGDGWTPRGAEVTGTGAAATIIESGAAAPARGFYRIRVVE